MMKDVSNQTVFVLAILAILISVLSVATIFFETSDVELRSSQGDSSFGRISVSIKEDAGEDVSEGRISVEIVDEGNETYEV